MIKVYILYIELNIDLKKKRRIGFYVESKEFDIYYGSFGINYEWKLGYEIRKLWSREDIGIWCMGEMLLDVWDFDVEFVNLCFFVVIKEKNYWYVLVYIKKGDNVNNRCKKLGMIYLYVVIKCVNLIFEIKYVLIIYLFFNVDIELNVVDNLGMSLF